MLMEESSLFHSFEWPAWDHQEAARNVFQAAALPALLLGRPKSTAASEDVVDRVGERLGKMCPGCSRPV